MAQKVDGGFPPEGGFYGITGGVRASGRFTQDFGKYGSDFEKTSKVSGDNIKGVCKILLKN